MWQSEMMVCLTSLLRSTRRATSLKRRWGGTEGTGQAQESGSAREGTSIEGRSPRVASRYASDGRVSIMRFRYERAGHPTQQEMPAETG